MKKLSQHAKERVDKMASAVMEQFKADSVQYALMHKDSILVSGAVGSYDKRGLKALDKDVMYGVGSVSKMYVTAAAMLLADQKKIDIGKTYKTYVPEFEMADKRYAKITVRMLMNHSSGIYGTHFTNSFLFEDNDTYTHDHLLDNLKSCRLKYDPGTFMEYCNDGFQLLEILVERVSKMRYNEFLAKKFFEPLGLKNTKTPLDYFDKTQMARVYQPMYEGPQPMEITNVIGTGGIISTAEEMCRFGSVLTGKKILSEQAAEQMRQREYLKGSIWPADDEEKNLFAYGLGWDHVHLPPFDKHGITAVTKGGDTMHYHAALICLPEQELYAAAASAGGVSFLDGLIATELLMSALKENKIIKAEDKPAVPKEMLKFNGVYANNGGFAEIDTKDGIIELPAMLGLIPPQKYTYAGDGRFNSADGKVSLHFQERGSLTFLQGDITFSFPDIGDVPWKSFLYQKLEKNRINKKTAAVWEKRKDKRYLRVDDKYSSLQYLSATGETNIKVSVNTDIGYAFGGCKIIDENFAQNVLYFRDVADLCFFMEGGAEYVTARGSVFISEDSVPCLAAGSETVEIASNGYAGYYKIGEDLAGKTLTVKLPKAGALAVYNAAGEYKNLSTVTGKAEAQLEAGDLVAFLGAAGCVFGVAFSQN